MFSDNFFKKVEKKANVNKETILSLADKLQKGNMKDETTLKEVINDLAKMTGREVSKEKEEKIISTNMCGKGAVCCGKGRQEYIGQCKAYNIYALCGRRTYHASGCFLFFRLVHQQQGDLRGYGGAEGHRCGF